MRNEKYFLEEKKKKNKSFNRINFSVFSHNQALFAAGSGWVIIRDVNKLTSVLVFSFFN